MFCYHAVWLTLPVYGVQQSILSECACPFQNNISNNVSMSFTNTFCSRQTLQPTRMFHIVDIFVTGHTTRSQVLFRGFPFFFRLMRWQQGSEDWGLRKEWRQQQNIAFTTGSSHSWIVIISKPTYKQAWLNQKIAECLVIASSIYIKCYKYPSLNWRESLINM